MDHKLQRSDGISRSSRIDAVERFKREYIDPVLNGKGELSTVDVKHILSKAQEHVTEGIINAEQYSAIMKQITQINEASAMREVQQMQMRTSVRQEQNANQANPWNAVLGAPVQQGPRAELCPRVPTDHSGGPNHFEEPIKNDEIPQVNGMELRSAERDTVRLVAERVRLIVDAVETFTLYLDEKSQILDLFSEPVILRFCDGFRAVMLNGRRFSTNFGARLPFTVTIPYAGQHFFRFTALNPNAEKVVVRARQGSQIETEDGNSQAFGPFRGRVQKGPYRTVAEVWPRVSTDHSGLPLPGAKGPNPFDETIKNDESRVIEKDTILIDKRLTVMETDSTTADRSGDVDPNDTIDILGQQLSRIQSYLNNQSATSSSSGLCTSYGNEIDSRQVPDNIKNPTHGSVGDDDWINCGSKFSLLKDESQSIQNQMEIIENGDDDDVSHESEEDEGPFSVNPFLLSEVVKTVLKHVDTNMLFSTRLVSWEWNVETCKILKKDHTIKFKSVSDVKQFMYAVRFSSPTIQFQRFSLCNISLSNLRDDYHINIINKFLSLYGGTIKYCKFWLNESTIGSNQLWTCLYNMTNLEELSLVFTYGFGSEFGGDGGMTLFESARRCMFFAMNNQSPNEKLANDRHRILPRIKQSCQELNLEGPNEAAEEPEEGLHLHSPLVPKLQLKLQHIVLDIEGKSGCSEKITNFLKTLFSEVAVTLQRISCPSYFAETMLGKIIFNSLKESEKVYNNLQRLDFWCKITTMMELQHLARFATQLTHLKLVLGHGIKRENFERMLLGCCSSLQNLQLIFQNESLKQGFQFPARMSRLKSLNLIGCPLNLHFLQNTPVLQELLIHGIPLNLLLEQLSTYKRHTQIKRLEVTGSDGQILSREFILEMDSFHEITKMELENVSDATLDLLYKTMPNLIELKISGCFTDEGITGLPELRCQEFGSDGLLFIVDDHEHRRYLYIGCLRELKSLTLTSDKISDASIMFGVKRLNKLEKLVLTSHNLTDIGAEALGGLNNNVALDVQDCEFSEPALKKLDHVLMKRNSKSDETGPITAKELLNFNHTEFLPSRRNELQVVQPPPPVNIPPVNNNLDNNNVPPGWGFLFEL